jgi:hypothetical protein
MRALIILLAISQFSFAGKKSCKNLDAQVQKALEAQRMMTSRGIRGKVRDELTRLLDEGYKIHPKFFQQVYQRKSYKANGFAKTELLDEHVEKHLKEFGLSHKSQYLRKAQDFAKSMDDDIMTFVSKREIYRYNPVTNEYMVLSRNGKRIGTFYKPDLKVINDRRKVNDLPPYKSVSEWFITNKWERYNLNNNFQ